MELESYAAAALNALASDPEQLMRFMSACGYAPHSLRQAIGTPELDTALLSHLATNEPLLLAVCANNGLSAEHFMSCWQRINHQTG